MAIATYQCFLREHSGKARTSTGLLAYRAARTTSVHDQSVLLLSIEDTACLELFSLSKLKRLKCKLYLSFFLILYYVATLMHCVLEGI
jgi:hypothetical protein